MHSNQAIAEGAIAAGCRFYAGYPITPSTEIAESLSGRLPEVGGVYIQMEDEIASMAAVIGASLGGLKSATATSGPGFSLMQENLGFAVVGEVPCVIVNVQRVGPSTGLPTKVAQGDVMQARWGTHGDHRIITLYPSSAQEAFDLTVKAFNLAERFRTPVILLSDAVVAGLLEKVDIPDPADLEVVSRARPTVAPEQYRPFDYSSSDIPPLAEFGSGYRFHITGLLHDESGAPTEDSEVVARWWAYMQRKLDDHLDEILDWDEILLDDADTAVVAYGCTARSAEHAVELARERGHRVGLLKLKTIWPFGDAIIDQLADRIDRFVVPELNLGQIRLEVQRVVGGRAKVEGINRADGLQISPEQILDVIAEKALA
jgi:2-oxoglutarate ferredoxin oxidoreductase subunit alpha|tara:strand:+ start:1377 stop:2495 length:1119 start_codon:yes stop_codon:yes gene_type:complete